MTTIIIIIIITIITTTTTMQPNSILPNQALVWTPFSQALVNMKDERQETS